MQAAGVDEVFLEGLVEDVAGTGSSTTFKSEDGSTEERRFEGLLSPPIVMYPLLVYTEANKQPARIEGRFVAAKWSSFICNKLIALEYAFGSRVFKACCGN